MRNESKINLKGIQLSSTDDMDRRAIKMPPESNVFIEFGDLNLFLHRKRRVNIFHRWMYKLFFGINIQNCKGHLDPSIRRKQWNNN